MVDWLTVEIPARLPEVIAGGVVAKWDRDGEIEWNTISRLELEGSWSGKVLVRSICKGKLEVSGNIAKFMAGHNLYGSDDPKALLKAFLRRIQPTLWPAGMPRLAVGRASISRIDVTSGMLLRSPADVLSYLKAVEERGNCAFRGRGVFKGEGTLVYGDATGGRAKAWQLTMYAKGLEVAKRHLPAPMMERPDVIEWVNRLLRVEVRLRTAELKRLGRVLIRDWKPGAAASAWREKVDRIAVMEGTVMAGNEMVEVKPRLVAFYRAWASGDDLRQCLTKPTFYRVRRELRDAFGVDVALRAPRSNVIPLRRVLIAEPVSRPHWADSVDALLVAKAA